MRRGTALLALAGLLVAACASNPPRREAPPGDDRTGDPRFRAAVEAAEREFATQADALASGVYEPFVHPDSARPAAAPPESPRPAVRQPVFAADPTTEELLGTLPPPEPYNRTPERRPTEETPPLSAEDAAWTLQVGAFGSETGAFVRLRQLARDFPDWPSWHAAGGGVVRVYLGRFESRAAAERGREEAAERGYADAWIVAAP